MSFISGNPYPTLNVSKMKGSPSQNSPFQNTQQGAVLSPLNLHSARNGNPLNAVLIPDVLTHTSLTSPKSLSLHFGNTLVKKGTMMGLQEQGIAIVSDVEIPELKGVQSFLSGEKFPTQILKTSQFLNPLPTSMNGALTPGLVILHGATLTPEKVVAVENTLEPHQILALSGTNPLELNKGIPKLKHPSRVVKMTFLTPVDKNKVVEIIPGPLTAPETVLTLQQLIRSTAKIPVVLKKEIPSSPDSGLSAHLKQAVAREVFRLSQENPSKTSQKKLESLTQALFGEKLKNLMALASQNPSVLPAGVPNKKELSGKALESSVLGAVFLESLTLLRDGVCGPMDLENVARVALRWKQGPLGLMNQKTPAEVAACIDSVKTPGQAIPPIPQAPWDLTGVRTSTRNGVRYITLDRMGELNTLTGPVIQKVHDAVLAGEQDPAVKVIVLESNGGKVLSAGADTKMFRDAPSMEASRGAIELGKQLLDRVAKSTKLTVAKVQGATFGASTELVLPFDRLIVTDDFSMKLPEVNIGLAPVWGGTERLLQKAGRPLGEAIILNGRFEFGLLKHLPKPLQKLVNGPLNIDIDKGTGFVLDAQTGKRLGVFDAVVPRQHLDDTLEALLKDPQFLEKPNPNRGIEKYLSPTDYPQDIQDAYQLNNPKTFSPPSKLGRYSKRSWFLAKRLIDQVGTPQEGKLTEADHTQIYQDTQGKMQKVQALKDLAMAMAQKRPLAFLKQLYSVLVK